MESLDKKTNFAHVVTYKAMFMTCIIISVGLCSSVLPTLMSAVASTDESNLLYVIPKLGLVFVTVVGEILLVWMINRKVHFHQNQEVFWPERCQHCAKVVGILKGNTDRQEAVLHSRDLPTSSTQSTLRTRNPQGEPKTSLSFDSSARPSPMGSNAVLPRCNGATLVQGSRGDLEVSFSERLEAEPGTISAVMSHSTDLLLSSEASNYGNVEDGVRPLHDEPLRVPTLFSKPHKSLLRVFSILGIISITHSPIIIIADSMCIAYGNGSTIAHVVQVLSCVCYISTVLVAIAFFHTYQDSVFIQEPRGCYVIGLCFACSIWITMNKITNPFDYLLVNSSGSEPTHYPCKLNGTFGNFVTQSEAMILPFSAECGIIAAGIFWQMWSNTFPRSVLNLQPPENLAEISSKLFGPTRSTKQVTRSLRKFLLLLRHYVGARQITERKRDSAGELGRFLISTSLTLILIFGGYFAFIQYLEFGSFYVTKKTKAYIRWSCEMAVSLPLIALLFYQSRVSRTSVFPLKSGVSVLNGFGNHDKILLLSCGFIFLLNIFRFVGAINLLLRPESVTDYDEFYLAVYAVVYSSFELFLMWMMTLFLFVVQRQLIVGTRQIKWTLVCLLYTVVYNGVQWVIHSFETDDWVLLQAAFGDKSGKVLGLWLEPVAALYGIHAAIVAYEAYKDIFSATKLET